jgi:hypothetical protein
VIAERINALDTSIFEHIESQTTVEDRRSLLALHAAIAERGEFSYLEIGSHLGGTLQAVIADPRCVRVVSIDSRPAWQPDDRLGGYDYADNSTDRMLRFLGQVPGADLGKLETFDASTEAIDPARITCAPSLCFIDGEHTCAAALRDARFCRMIGGGVIAFHDYERVTPAIRRFIRETDAPRAYRLRSFVFVVELQAPSLLAVTRVQLGRPRLGWGSANRLGVSTLPWMMLALDALARRVRDRVAR